MNKQIEQFYIDNQSILLKKLYHRAGGYHNAEDILQEAFCRALKYSSSFDPSKQPLEAWFVTIMNNALKTFKRDEKSMGTFVEADEANVGSEELDETDGDMYNRVVSEINLRKGRTKDALYLYFVKEYKPREIRDVLDMPVASVKTVVYRFKAEMNEKFRGSFYD